MTNEEIRIAVAEEMGWQDVTVCHDCVIGLPPGFTEDQCPEGADEFVPDYPNSLDACAEFEDSLTYAKNERARYHDALNRICARDNEKLPPSQCRGTYRATARQRCEAFLRMRGKWKEVGK